MDEALEGLARFDAVWGRVSGGDGAAAPGLGELVEQAERQRERLCALARRRAGWRAKLLAMASELAALILRLRAEHFLSTGGDCRPGEACAVVKEPLAALREAYLGSSALADRLQEAANAAPCELRPCLDALAAGERRRARELRGMILRALGVNYS